MSSLSIWLRSLAAVSVISAVINLLIPEVSLKRAYKTLSAAVIVSVMLSVVQGGAFEGVSLDFEADRYNTDISEKYEKYIEKNLLNEAEKEIKNNICQELDGYKVEVRCSITESRDVKIKVIFEDYFNSSERDNIIEKVREITGDETEILFGGDNDE